MGIMQLNISHEIEQHEVFFVLLQDIVCALDVLLAAVHRLMSLYCTSFLPGYQPEWDLGSRERLSIGSKPDHLLRVKVSTLHRPVEAELRK